MGRFPTRSCRGGKEKGKGIGFGDAGCKEKDDDISDDESENDEMEDVELEYPYKQIMKVKDGRIRGVQQMIVDEWVGYSVGFSDGTFTIIDTEGNVQMEMNTGMRITAMATISW